MNKILNLRPPACTPPPFPLQLRRKSFVAQHDLKRCVAKHNFSRKVQVAFFRKVQVSFFRKVQVSFFRKVQVSSFFRKVQVWMRVWGLARRSRQGRFATETTQSAGPVWPGLRLTSSASSTRCRLCFGRSSRVHHCGFRM